MARGWHIDWTMKGQGGLSSGVTQYRDKKACEYAYKKMEKAPEVFVDIRVYLGDKMMYRTQGWAFNDDIPF